MNRNCVARLTVFDASKMTTRGRWSIAVWLFGQAAGLISGGRDYAHMFTASFATGARGSKARARGKPAEAIHVTGNASADA